jgi:hypothetical protein
VQSVIVVAERAEILAVAARIELALDKVELVSGVGKVVHVIELCFGVGSVADVDVLAITFGGEGIVVQCVVELLGLDAVGLVAGAVGIVPAVEFVVNAVGVIDTAERCLRVESESATNDKVVVVTIGGAGVAVERVEELLGLDAVGLVVVVTLGDAGVTVERVRELLGLHALKLSTYAVEGVSIALVVGVAKAVHAIELCLRIEKTTADVEVFVVTFEGATVAFKCLGELPVVGAVELMVGAVEKVHAIEKIDAGEFVLGAFGVVFAVGRCHRVGSVAHVDMVAVKFGDEGVVVESVAELLGLDAARLVLGAVKVVHKIDFAVNVVGVDNVGKRGLCVQSAAGVLMVMVALEQACVAVERAEEFLGLDAVELVVGAVEKVHAVEKGHAVGLVLGAVGVVHTIVLVVQAVAIVDAVERCLRVQNAAGVLMVMVTLDQAVVAVG